MHTSYVLHVLFYVVPDFFPPAGKGRPAAVVIVKSGLYFVFVSCVCIPLAFYNQSYVIEISMDGYALFLTYILPTLWHSLTTLLVPFYKSRYSQYTDEVTVIGPDLNSVSHWCCYFCYQSHAYLSL